MLSSILVLVAILSGCGHYSFTGASIPSHLNTVAVPIVEDLSVSPVTTLSDELTQLLVQRIVGQTRLSLEPDENAADAVLTARIDRYSSQPAAVSAQEVATRNRVTLTVTVRYYDRVREEEIVSRTFSSYTEYDPTSAEAEAQAARVALQQIADDIFTAATSNW